ncbi:MAG: TetR family transcriptional regulator [Chloroflexi bacterium]|nr:TetR family transcriptional regulator [Chloroflexota bacterium]
MIMEKTTNQKTSKTKSVRQTISREEIIQKAAGLIEQRGYRAVSVDSIVDLVGISKPTFYSYLEGKDKIVWAIFDEISAESLMVARAILASNETAREKLHQLIRRHLEALVHKRVFYAIYFEEKLQLPKRLQNKHHKAQRDYEKMVEEVIQQGICEGVFPDVNPKIAALGLLGMCNWVAKWYKEDGTFGPHEMADTFFAMLVRPEQSER